MTKKLYRNENLIYRLLASEGNMVLLINCISRRMPCWFHITDLENFTECTEEDLFAETGKKLPDIDDVSAMRRNTAYHRFTIIAGILPVITDNKERSRMIQQVSKMFGVSSPTTRTYLCEYLTFQSISALLPEERKCYQKPLTADQRIFRWAINKFYYSSHKNSLWTAYSLMLKERYSEKGVLEKQYPSFNQFRYFYSKYRKLQSVYISREGMKAYKRDYRPLLGDRNGDYANHIGVGEIDSTICNIHLVDDYDNFIGRPVLTILTDSFSNGYIYGYSLGLEQGTYSVRNLLINCLADKTEWCEKFGISLKPDAWEIKHVLPGTIVSDMGSEYASETLSQITELGITLVNLPPLRPELKSVVEKSFDLIQESIKPTLMESGYVDRDYGKRLTRDSRKSAILTMREYEKCVIYAILYHNNDRVLENYPYTEAMLDASIKPHPTDVFMWGKEQEESDLRKIDKADLILTLLPRVKGCFTRRGLIVKGLRYKARENEFTEDYLKGGEAIVAYDPEDVDRVFLVREGQFTEFSLIESRFTGKSFEEVEELLKRSSILVKDAERKKLQGRIELQRNIEEILQRKKGNSEINLKDVRQNRARERDKHHIDFLKEIEI